MVQGLHNRAPKLANIGTVFCLNGFQRAEHQSHFFTQANFVLSGPQNERLIAVYSVGFWDQTVRFQLGAASLVPAVVAAGVIAAGVGLRK